MSTSGRPPPPRRRKQPSKTGPPKGLEELFADLQREHESKQVDRAIEWLEKKWGEKGTPCPYCKDNDWRVGSPVGLLYAQDLGGRRPEHMSPHFPVMCRNCGHTLFINAVVSEVSPEPTEEGEGSE